MKESQETKVLAADSNKENKSNMKAKPILYSKTLLEEDDTVVRRNIK